MRSNGILLHISSLPSNYGIGTLGKAAYDFADYLEKARVEYWQILPIGPTSYGDSPYQSFSSFAGNPYFVDLDMLCEDGYLNVDEVRNTFWGDKNDMVDYANMYDKRFPILRKACDAFRNVLNKDNEKYDEKIAKEYNDFRDANKQWVEDYALFMALKDAHEGKAWVEWEDGLKTRNKEALDEATTKYNKEVENYIIIQYFFDKQWKKFREYLKEKEIKLIGDVPIYVAYDSVEVWKEPELFALNKDLSLKEASGCPPDYFNEDGQLWGNPIYNWKKMEADNYSWWMKRLRRIFDMHDVVRIDHFRGFASYYSIDGDAENAKEGKWIKGPGIKIFDQIKKDLGDVDIIAEDLGFLTDDVIKLLKDTGYPGMKVLQFAFDMGDGTNPYMPHNYDKNSVVYTGTHDNETTLGWLQNTSDWVRSNTFACVNVTDQEGWSWGLIRTAHASVANWSVIQMQDYLGFGNDCRMNTPSTIGGNWEWRIRKETLTDELNNRIKELNYRFGRANWKKED
ncbi:MAG: 4-alpha-glucanotransferase [Lachnospiraceae bacterium]|nr:4-alpha-glucanotransferase [Lachnospiraceae bacterium]